MPMRTISCVVIQRIYKITIGCNSFISYIFLTTFIYVYINIHVVICNDLQYYKHSSCDATPLSRTGRVSGTTISPLKRTANKHLTRLQNSKKYYIFTYSSLKFIYIYNTILHNLSTGNNNFELFVHNI